MAVADNVYIMNEETWEIWRATMFEDAAEMTNPFKYLKFVSDLEVHTDNRLKFGVIEVYDKETFHQLNKDKDFWDTEDDIDFDPDGDIE